MLQRARQILRRIGSDRKGVALLEFALVSPFLILLLLGSVELVRYVLIVQKFDKAVYAMADVLSQSAPATLDAAPGELDADQLNGIFNLYTNMMAPFEDPARQAAMATSIHFDEISGDRIIRWQAAGGGTFAGAGVASVANGVPPNAVSPAVAGTTPTYPGHADVAGLMGGMLPGENTIIVETFFQYRPFLDEVLASFGFEIDPALLTRRVYMYPRSGGLLYLPPNFPVAP